ncbi:uncharacterized protein L969DRAFT_438828 [Mixia osmundae IAM 14324]|uniref:uncharacterized protein n=1 Tax=Mixia osmundae (strain CBS 9802 / IAM 14324 / JCM 22182 / KY 12970) TaxID=764103 RepID=UPI0004A555A0|nr:uncharacterized protein L969DRAFT_438828 [Mixia osmundae IAM 14324]KEI39317.1 hypothetical protein L969DRAFT_438828 [Mixia osmundae IAM 14324]
MLATCRKGVAKAQAKFEPNVFRDSLVKSLEAVPQGDFDGYAKELDTLGNTLEYRKYEDQLFQLLCVGRLLAPGGNYIQDDAPQCPVSIIGAPTAELADIRKVVEVFHKLIRRYKYLQKTFEETTLTNILQYVNKFEDPKAPAGTHPNQDKMAVATALLVSGGLVGSASVLASLKKDHVVKDGVSLAFITTYIRTYLTAETIDHLGSSLRRGGVADLILFFPPNKRTMAFAAEHFKKENLDKVWEFYQKQRSAGIREEMAEHLRTMVANEESHEEIATYLKEQFKSEAVSDVDFLATIWTNLLSDVDAAASAQQACETALKEIKDIVPLLEPYASSARAQVGLINTIQGWCYEQTKAMAVFPRALKMLYAADVLSDNAILYWHSKGSKPAGRQHFLTASEPLIKFLQEQEESEEEE